MQSKYTKTELYNRLGDIARDVDKALSSDNFNGIESLVTDHLNIMNQLRLSETPADPSMKPVIEEAEKHVKALMSRIREMQSEIKKQLSTMNNKKLIRSAYHV